MEHATRHMIPYNNRSIPSMLVRNLGSDGDGGESDHNLTQDHQLTEENKLLFAGFTQCVESKMAPLTSAIAASSSAKESSVDTS